MPVSAVSCQTCRKEAEKSSDILCCNSDFIAFFDTKIALYRWALCDSPVYHHEVRATSFVGVRHMTCHHRTLISGIFCLHNCASKLLGCVLPLCTRLVLVRMILSDAFLAQQVSDLTAFPLKRLGEGYMSEPVLQSFVVTSTSQIMYVPGGLSRIWGHRDCRNSEYRMAAKRSAKRSAKQELQRRNTCKSEESGSAGQVANGKPSVGETSFPLPNAFSITIVA